MVLLPCVCCGKARGSCACKCPCCTCASGIGLVYEYGIPIGTLGDPLNAAEELTYFLTDPIPAGETAPPGVLRRLLPSHYGAALDHIPECAITRRWDSQAACVSSVKSAEKYGIINAGVPYTYNLVKGRWANESLGKSVSISATFGSGAAATVTGQSKNEINAVTLSSGGSGYAVLVYEHKAPTITATAQGGSDAVLAVTLADPAGTAPYQTWGVQSISVTNGGTGYTNGGSVTLSAGSSTVVTAASASIVTREQPLHTVDASGAGGTGAKFSITYAQDNPGDSEWYVDFISVTDGGSGYSGNGTVLLVPEVGTKLADGSGDSVELFYETSGGAITSATDQGFLYYRDRGIIQSVIVGSSGAYYEEDKSKQPTVNTATASASVIGSNATFSVAIDSDPNSGSFGQITAISVVAANPHPPQPLVETNSSFSISDRTLLLEQLEENDANHELLGGAVTFATEQDIDSYLEALFSGALDLEQLHWGYCSDSTPLDNASGLWRLGWSTPYRNGSPVTISTAALLCRSGSPRGFNIVDGQYVPTAWGRPWFFPNQGAPLLQRVVLNGSTGDAVVDALLAVVGDFYGYDPILFDNPGYSVVAVKTVDEPEFDATGEAKLCVSYSIRKTDPAIQVGYQEWILYVCWRPCANAEDNAPLYTAIPEVFIHSYSLTHATYGTDLTSLITSSADLWAFASEEACRAEGFASPIDPYCANNAFRKWFNLNLYNTAYYCLSQEAEATD